MFRKMDSNYIGRVISVSSLYQRIPATLSSVFLCLVAAAFILARVVTTYMNKYVVSKIQDVIQKLELIAQGNLEATVDVQSSVEFRELSSHINRMVNSLLNNNKKMSYVLSKMNLNIGIYEYNRQMKKVRFTESIPEILSVDSDTLEQLASDADRFEEFLDEMRRNPVQDENVYHIGGKYIRLEEIRNDDEVFGVMVDNTYEIRKRREIEKERDVDSLTGLYNRRGLDTRLTQLFARPQELGVSAAIMIDADGLKEINDTYGHEKGDLYLKKISERITSFATKNSIAARQGGDEFVLFLYGYETEKELMEAIQTLTGIQSHSSAHLDENLVVQLQFSFGFSLTKGRSDYQSLLKEADERMYENKINRKRDVR